MDTENMLVQSIENGKVTKNTAVTAVAEEKSTRGTTNLGKDAFLQLLVAEMQNQDPLEPSTNTEWISQLATFSQLEELQSLTKTSENSQVFSLVGKRVIVQMENKAGNMVTKSGTVDFVTFTGGKAKFSINGTLYDMENFVSLVDDDYYYTKNAPSMKEKDFTFDFNGDDPEDMVFEVDFGEDIAKANNVALLVGDLVLSAEYVKVYDGKVTVSKELMNAMKPGGYSIDVVFDDKNFTTVSGGIKLNVYNTNPPEEKNESEDSESGQTN